MEQDSLAEDQPCLPLACDRNSVCSDVMNRSMITSDHDYMSSTSQDPMPSHSLTDHLPEAQQSYHFPSSLSHLLLNTPSHKSVSPLDSTSQPAHTIISCDLAASDPAVSALTCRDSERRRSDITTRDSQSHLSVFQPFFAQTSDHNTFNRTRDTSTGCRRTSCWLSHTMLISLFISSLAVSLSAEPCKFPAEWAGHWFQKGVPDPIRITESDISEKGSCKEISGDKFLIENRQERCIRCMVINQKHVNILQYKETFCFPASRTYDRNLRDVCTDINGDAPLYSLFRQDTPPVPCPFAGPFTFTYSRGHEECREPLSSIDSCTEESRLLLRFQACADVAGSESRVEELSCIGDWREGSVRYLVGKLEHRSAKTDEDKFRCFVFEKSRTSPGGLTIAQSGDATCDGLSSSMEGSRTMKLEPAEPIEASCTFPKFLTQPTNWRTLDGSEVYRFHQNSTFTVHNTSTGQIYTTMTCVRDMSHEYQPFLQFSVHAVSGCKIGYMCIRVHRRNNHIVEIEGSNNLAKNDVDACSQQQNYQNYLSITTFQPLTETCPIDGIYSVEVSPTEEEDLWATSSADDAPFFVCSEQSFLTSRCNSNDHMQLLSKCTQTSESTRNFFCHGTWKYNDTSYTVMSSSEDKKQYCLTHRTGIDGQTLGKKLTINSGSCPHPSMASTPSGSPFPSVFSLTGSQGSILHHSKPGALFLNILDHAKCQTPSKEASSASHPRIHIPISRIVMLSQLFACLTFLINKL